MIDEPRGPDVLAAVTKWLREQLLPQLPDTARFQAMVAATSLGTGEARKALATGGAAGIAASEDPSSSAGAPARRAAAS